MTSSSLKPGMLFLGYISQTNEKGCFIKIHNSTTIRAAVSELSDEHLANPSKELYANRLVLGRIISTKADGKIDASLRESVIKYGTSLNLDTLK